MYGSPILKHQLGVLQEGFEIVAMDFPGHGKSDATSKDAWYPLVNYPEYVVEVAR